MPPSKVSEDEWLCRFLVEGDWDEDKQRPTPGAFRASDRQLSLYHPETIVGLGSSLRGLCFDRLEGAGEAHLQVGKCIELSQGISDEFQPQVYWRPDKVPDPWLQWKDAHVQIESLEGNSSFPRSYRALLADNATCLRPPDE
ncbi:MAG: hypothetical protein OXH22_14005 [Chloroflexi bacterium]|nr:hypothetical protein [Chloroflexota bacterium]